MKRIFLFFALIQLLSSPVPCTVKAGPSFFQKEKPLKKLKGRIFNLKKKNPKDCKVQYLIAAMLEITLTNVFLLGMIGGLLLYTLGGRAFVISFWLFGLSLNAKLSQMGLTGYQQEKEEAKIELDK